VFGGQAGYSRALYKSKVALTVGEFGYDYTRLNLKVAISAKIGLNLAFQTSVEAKYDHRPGPLGIKNLAMGFVPEASKLDTIMKASFIYTFLGAKK
jgi:hypothetical protein